MLTRRKFLQNSTLASGALLMNPAWLSNNHGAGKLDISLAEWSLHRTIREGKLDHLDFPAKARSFGINAVEYVNGLFGTKTIDFRAAATDKRYLGELLKRSKDSGVINHLLMVDEEGHLAGLDGNARKKAVEDHKKWLDAAGFLECKTVRVNLHGEGSSEDKAKASIDSLSALGEYAMPMGLNVVVENHGSDSSKGFWVANVMKQVNKPNVGTLPDFGNFCINHPWGTTQEACSDEYDRYKGIEELLPFAKGVSAKSYDFDANGNQPKIDYKRLLDLVKASGFAGYIGIEFEGFSQPEEEGIRKTKQLLEKYLA
jgi:sugar phosphate isomerase/epimerase